jgi:hypothetical protein
MVAAACDSSPYAASINGQVIKQTALNADIRQLAGNSYYVQLAKQGVVTKAVTVAGSSSGSYNATWTASVLTDLIIGSVAHQHLEQTRDLPGPAQLAATRAVDGILYGPGAWGRFSPSFRTSLVERDADLAMVEPNMVTAAQLRSAASSYATQLFSDVCVRTVSVAVTGGNGSVDFAASQARAKSIAAAFNASPASVNAGSVTCYTAAQFETESLSFVVSVLNIRTGKAGTPTKTADGYQVTAVTSRTTIPIGLPLERAFTAAVNQSQGQTAAKVAGLLAKAHVKINPLYGTWSGSARSTYGVVPPRAPASS